MAEYHQEWFSFPEQKTPLLTSWLQTCFIGVQSKLLDLPGLIVRGAWLCDWTDGRCETDPKLCPKFSLSTKYTNERELV